jgi:hypothetical protein
MEKIQSYWFTESMSEKPIGIIKVSNEHDVKYYIGTGWGTDIKEDEKKIIMYGAKFPWQIGEFLFK